MRRFLAFTFLLTTSFGCVRDEAEVQQDQRRERTELAEEQARERQVLENEQSAELGEAREAARENLIERADEAREERRDSIEANQDLAAAITLACSGVDSPDRCPIDEAALGGVTDSERGVQLTLGREAGTRAQVAQRIDCYRARVSLRGTAATPCFIDIADDTVTITTNQTRGRVVVSFEATDGNVITPLRDRSAAFIVDANRRQALELRN